MAADAVDSILWYRAPMLLGGDGLPAVAGLGVTTPDGAPRFDRLDCVALDSDMLETYRRRP